MKVRELMTKCPACCDADMNLAAASEVMWAHDCGAIPVISNEQLVGIITDRDISIALGTRDRAASQLRVGDVANRQVLTCAPEDTVRSAMATMRQGKVRRLPVVNSSGELVGILSLNDMVLAAGHRPGQIDPDEIVTTMKGVCEHRDPQADAPGASTLAAA